MSPDGTYNGYANYQTWNVCLWISNDDMLNTLASCGQCESYEHFRTMLRDLRNAFNNEAIAFETPDGVAWNDSAINLVEMREYWTENFSKVCS